MSTERERAPRVFVADDDASFRAGLVRALRDLEYLVVEASDGASALETLAAAADGALPAFDVVILDVCMPGYSGLGILDVTRRFGDTPPIILVTGFGDPSIDLLAGRRGALRVFHKPVELDELLAAVADGIERSRSSHPLPARGPSGAR